MKSVVIMVSLVVVSFFSSSAFAQTATVYIDNVEVYSSKANGKAWDAFGGRPDIKVRVKEKGILGSSSTTSVSNDCYTATIKENTISISAGDAIIVEVIDQDVSSDDMIGSFEYVVKASDIRDGGFVAHDFDRVENLVIRLK